MYKEYQLNQTVIPITSTKRLPGTTVNPIHDIIKIL